MKVTSREKEVLRSLAGRVAEIAALPVHGKKIGMWKDLNELRPVRPLVWINELPWHEMDVDGELTSCCKEGFLNEVEGGLRSTIYLWTHMPADMVIEPKFLCHAVIKSSDFGITEDSDTTTGGGSLSRHFHGQFTTPEDAQKIKLPTVTHDKAETERRIELLTGIFGDLLPVEFYGIGFQWFAPWDRLICWYGVQEAMTDMAINPETVHACMERLVAGYFHALKQVEEQNLLALNNGNFRIGSGGLGYTGELPRKDFTPGHVRTIDQWGNATPQIFSEISPAMHEEFALRYERPWLAKFGLTYYGCCEPLHNKMGLLKTIPNLRKVSVSPKADKRMIAGELGKKYVASLKPNPALLATDVFDENHARAVLREELAQLKGCGVEIILKDVTTIRRDPRRLWAWAKMAVETAHEAG